MTVYIDVLISVNIIVDYFLILLAAKFLNIKVKTSKIILSAIVGGFFSIYIFFPHFSIIVDTLFKLICSIIMVLVAFGYKNIKRLFRCSCFLFVISFIYGGAMLAIANIFPLKAIMVHNSIVYYDISPLMLILFTGSFYIIAIGLKFALKRNNALAKNCSVQISFNGLESNFEGIFDTGNSVKDILCGSEVLIIDKTAATKLLKGEPKDYPSAYRVIPISTVSGARLLEGIRCEKASIHFDNKCLTLDNPVLAISETKIDKEYSVLLNPEILTKAEA